MPRIGTFAAASGVDFFGRSMITIQFGGGERRAAVTLHTRAPA